LGWQYVPAHQACNDTTSSVKHSPPKTEAIGKPSDFPLDRTVQRHLKPTPMLSPRLPKKKSPKVSSIKLPNQIRMEKRNHKTVARTSLHSFRSVIMSTTSSVKSKVLNNIVQAEEAEEVKVVKVVKIVRSSEIPGPHQRDTQEPTAQAEREKKPSTPVSSVHGFSFFAKRKSACISLRTLQSKPKPREKGSGR
jgi:hypothetical protein